MLVDEAVYVEGRRHEGHDSIGTGGFSWVGMFEPTLSELRNYQSHFHLDDLAIDDAIAVHQRPKIDQFDAHSFLVLKTVSIDADTRRLVIGNVSMFFSDNAVVTVRQGAALPLSTIRRDLEARPDRLKGGPSVVVHEVVDRLVDQYVDVVRAIAVDVSEIEDSVFDDDKPAEPVDIYRVKRELIDFRRAVGPLLDPLERLIAGVKYIDPGFRNLFSDIRDHLLKVLDEVDALNQLMDAAMQANMALISVKQNEDMRKISAWVGIAAVPTMVAGIYGMNFDYMPETGNRYGYFVVVGAMACAAYVLYRTFRRNKWL